MRHRITISLQAKSMLATIKGKIGTPNMSLSLIAEMCIQSAYDNMMNGDCFRDELNPTQRKLDEILILLQQILPEV